MGHAPGYFYVVRPQNTSQEPPLPVGPPQADGQSSVAAALLLAKLQKNTSFKPENLQKIINEFSSNYGSLRCLTKIDSESSDINASRSWKDWSALTDFLDGEIPRLPEGIAGDSQFIFGALSTSLQKSLSSRYQKAPNEKTFSFSAASAVCDKGLSSPILEHLSSLVQDIYLSEHASVEGRCVSRFSVFHGLGLPRTFVNGKQLLLTGLADKGKDTKPASLLSTELLLFRLLLSELGTQKDLDVKALGSELPRPLFDFVMHVQNRSSDEKSIDDHFIDFLMPHNSNVANNPNPLENFKKESRTEIKNLLSSLAENRFDKTATERVLKTQNCFSLMLEALTQLQHNIRYQSDDCKIPNAGIGRAYFNSMIRNWMCNILDFTLPAEIAQFDLLLRAKRANNNSLCNDYSVNSTLIEHLRETAVATDCGANSSIRRALHAMTEFLEDSASQDDSVFVFDESGLSTTLSQNKLIT